MAYAQTIWTNREVEKPRTYTFQDNGDGTTTLIPAEGNIISAGTPIMADNLNNIEEYLAYLAINTEVVDKQSNSNGHYIRWANGQQLMWGQINYTITTGAVGSVFAQTLTLKTLPADFSHNTYYAGLTGYFTECIGLDIRTRTMTTIEPRIFTSVAVTSKVIDIGFFCFGRWYE
jgi:hypothetical protein